MLKLKKASASVRSRFFTKRACDVETFYFEVGRADPKISEQERITQGINLTESEKVLLSVLSMQQVDRTYECNVYRFKMLIERLKPSSMLDY
jgi:succinylglutamate desuccinylase